MYTHIQTFVLGLFNKIINFYDRQQALQQNKFLCGPGNEKKTPLFWIVLILSLHL